MGVDPLLMNLADPRGQELNQPRIVQYILSGLDLRIEDTTWLGITIICLFTAGIFLSLRPIPNKTAWILALYIFSPSVMLGVERGNHDLFVFFLVALGLAWPSARYLPFVALMMATAIKLFPVFSVAFFLKHEFKRFLVLAALFMGLFGLYMLINWADLAQIFATTRKGYGAWAYGTKAFIQPPQFWQSFIPMFVIIPAVAGFAVWRWRKRDPEDRADDGIAVHIDGFRVGAAIYLGTFFLGNNWNYRLAFLIFVIPQLVDWMREAGRRFPAAASLATVFLSSWTLMFLRQGFYLAVFDEVVNWLLFVFLLYLMFDSLPAWAKAPFRNRSAAQVA